MRKDDRDPDFSNRKRVLLVEAVRDGPAVMCLVVRPPVQQRP